MVLSIPKWPHSLWNQCSCFGREKEVTTDLAHGLNQITLSLCTQQKQVTVLMLWLTVKPVIPNQAPKAPPNHRWTFKTGVHTATKSPGCSMVKGLKKTGQDPEESNKKKTQPCEQRKSTATKRGCLEQFGFLSQPSSLKKQKKEDLPKTLVCEEKKIKPVSTNAANVASPQVLSQLSKGEEKKKTSNYEESRVRKFQWNWLTLIPWLRITMQCLNSDEQYSYPYPQVQPPNCVVQSMFCDACSQVAKTSSGADISKKSGTKVFKIETLKKHEKSQAHVSCTETLKARQKPQESPLAKSLNKASTSADAKLEKKILTAFTVVALERPFDDYECVCALQKH